MTYDKQLTRWSQAAEEPFRVLMDGKWITLEPKRYYAVTVDRAGRGGRGKLNRRVVEVKP